MFVYRPQLKHLQTQVQGEVKKIMSTQFYAPGMKRKSEHCQIKPALIASCSAFGPKVLFCVCVLDMLSHHYVKRMLSIISQWSVYI